MNTQEFDDADDRFADTRHLLNEWRAGDEGALQALIDRYRHPLEFFIRKRISLSDRRTSETSDYVNDAIRRALEGLEAERFEYRGIGTFWSWLRTIALNHIREEWRGRLRDRKIERLPDESWAAPADREPTPLESAMNREQIELFETALETLQDKERTAFLMRQELRASWKVVAQECGYSTADVARVAARRAERKVLKEMTHG